MKKKITVAFLTFFLLCTSLTACGLKDLGGMKEDRQKAVHEDTLTIYETLARSFAYAETVEDLLQAIIAFADENEIYYRTDGQNLLLVRHGENESAQGITLHCSLASPIPKEDPTQATDGQTAKQPEAPSAQDYAKALTVAPLLSAIKNCQNDGNVTVLITTESHGVNSAATLPKDYLKENRLVSLSQGEKDTFITTSAAVVISTFSGTLKTEKPDENAKAYRIRIEGLPAGNTAEKEEDAADPLQRLNKILSWCESSHLDYRVASFNAGDSVYETPAYAEVVVTINPSDKVKFFNKVTTDRVAFLEDYGQGPTVHYIFTSVDLPDKVLVPACTTDLLGVLYTLRDSFDYLSKNDVDNTIALHDITTLNIGVSTSKLTVCSRYKEAFSTDTLEKTFGDLAELNRFSVSLAYPYVYWKQNKESDLYTSFTEAADQADLSLDSKRGGYINYATGTFVQRFDSPIDMVQLAVSQDSLSQAAEALINLIEMSNVQ